MYIFKAIPAVITGSIFFFCKLNQMTFESQSAIKVLF